MDSVESSRTLVNEEVINKYFHQLEKHLLKINQPQIIFNYNETNITDNPGAKLVIIHQGHNMVERVMYHSKSSISMFAE